MKGRYIGAGRCRLVKVWDDLKVLRPSAPDVRKRTADGVGHSYKLITEDGR